MPVYGPFNREKNTTTQTDEIAQLQKSTGEIWGRTPVQKGFTPTVEAYPGNLINGVRGIEFSTPTLPHPNSAPNHAKWYLGTTPDVVSRYKDGEEFACIYADVTVLQP